MAGYLSVVVPLEHFGTKSQATELCVSFLLFLSISACYLDSQQAIAQIIVSGGMVWQWSLAFLEGLARP